LPIDVQQSFRKEIQKQYRFLIQHILVKGSHIAHMIEFIVPHILRIDHIEPILDSPERHEHELVTGSLQLYHHTVLTLLLSVLDVTVQRNLEFGDVTVDEILQSG
jgi:hypothetical protein